MMTHLYCLRSPDDKFSGETEKQRNKIDETRKTAEKRLKASSLSPRNLANTQI